MSHIAAGADGDKLRVDAQANRRRILDTARQVFLESGLHSPMHAIARRAGVGTATLYRRFPTRDDLIAAVFVDEVNTCIDLVVQAAEDPDPWRGFTTMFDKLLGLDAVNRGLIRAFFVPQPRRPALGDGPQRAERAFVRLIARAKQAGRSDPTSPGSTSISRCVLTAGSMAMTLPPEWLHPAVSPPLCSMPSLPLPKINLMRRALSRGSDASPQHSEQARLDRDRPPCWWSAAPSRRPVATSSDFERTHRGCAFAQPVRDGETCGA